MRTVDIAEFSPRLRDVIERMQESGDELTVTIEGRPAAVIRPAAPPVLADQCDESDDLAADLEAIEELAREIGRHWGNGPSAVDAVISQRR